MHSYLIHSNQADAERVCADVEARLHERGIGDSKVYAVILALDELLTNIISYGFDDEEDGSIEVVLNFDAERIELVISDNGRPFNPFTVPEPDTGASLDERKIGGLGIHLIKEKIDEYGYEYRDGKNRVTLITLFADKK